MFHGKLGSVRAHVWHAPPYHPLRPVYGLLTYQFELNSMPPTVSEGDKECDGLDAADCPGGCTANCKCRDEAPAVSEWGLIALVLLLLVGMAIIFGHDRPQTR